MVHALHEAHRVLKSNGLLLDLRPAAVHRRVGLAQADVYRLQWVMRESFEDDHAADRAVARVLREGLFKAEARTGSACYRVMDTFDEFQDWLTDFVTRGKCPSHDWLVQRLERALAALDGKAGIVVSAPLVLRVMRKPR